jgi:putative PEP-CTERM system TPR-repeat lipoprotein
MGNKNRGIRTVATVFGAILLANGGLAACTKMQSSEAFVEEAKKYQQKGDSKAAVIQLKNAIQKNPDDSEARYLLASIYNDTGDPHSAEKEFRKALDLGVKPEKVLPGLSRALLRLGQYQKMLDETSQIAAQGDFEVLTLRGHANLALGKAPEAKNSYERALKEKADHPDALLGMSRLAMSQRDADLAMQFAERALATDPKNPNAWQQKGDLLRAQNKIDPALAAYDRAISLKPDDPSAYLNKAILEIHSQKFDAAQSNIEAARKVAPNGAMGFYAQALLDHNRGKHSAALESLQLLLRAAPDHMPANLLAGSVQLALGATQQAEQHIKKYLDKDPGNLQANRIFASVLLKSGQNERALAVINAALKDAPEDGPLLALAGESHMRTKDFAKATKYFERASARVPNAAPVRTALAVSNLAQGDSNRAIAELEAAIGMDGKSTQAGVLLIMTHVRSGQYDKALAAAMILEREQPDNPLVHNLKGVVYIGKKDNGAARKSFEKAFSLQPKYFPAVASLARLDMLEKRPDEAKKRLESYLEKDKKNAQAMSALAGLAISQGKNAEATEWLERANRENPDEVLPAVVLTSHYLRQNDKEKALTFARKLHATHPTNPDVVDALAQAQLANNERQSALESYRKLASLVPTSPIPQLRVASTSLAMQDTAGATEALKKALAIQPDNLDAQMMMAAIDVRAGRHEEALTNARKVQKQHSKSAVGHALEGDILIAQNKPALAAKAYERALSYNKSGATVLKVHDSLKKSGKEKEADARLAQWLKENPNDTSVRLHLATVSLRNKQNKAAIEQFEAVVQRDENNVVALNNLAWLLQEEKDQRALQYAERAYALAPGHPGVLDTLGWILVEQGNTARGLPLLQKAASLAPQSVDIQYHLIQAMVKSGDNANARKELEQLIESKKNFSKLDEAKELLKRL